MEPAAAATALPAQEWRRVVIVAAIGLRHGGGRGRHGQAGDGSRTGSGPPPPPSPLQARMGLLYHR